MISGIISRDDVTIYSKITTFRCWDSGRDPKITDFEVFKSSKSTIFELSKHLKNTQIPLQRVCAGSANAWIKASKHVPVASSSWLLSCVWGHISMLSKVLIRGCTPKEWCLHHCVHFAFLVASFLHIMLHMI